MPPSADGYFVFRVPIVFVLIKKARLYRSYKKEFYRALRSGMLVLHFFKLFLQGSIIDPADEHGCKQKCKSQHVNSKCQLK